MYLKIIDNKKIQLTNDEWNLYEKIVDSYTTVTNKGEDLFHDLFETDDNGIIIFLKPPSTTRSSLEVFLYLVAVMNQQHIRIMYAQVADLAEQVKEHLKKQ